MKFRYIIVILALAALAYGAVRYATREKPVEVTVKQADKGIVESTVANTRAGTVKARHRARLAPAIGGRIATLDVKKGDQVKKDQVLLTLWNDDIRSQLKLARQEAAAAEMLVRESCLMADFAERNANRLTELRRKKSTSEFSHDEALTKAAAGKPHVREPGFRPLSVRYGSKQSRHSLRKPSSVLLLGVSLPRSMAKSANSSPLLPLESPPCPPLISSVLTNST